MQTATIRRLIIAKIRIDCRVNDKGWFYFLRKPKRILDTGRAARVWAANAIRNLQNAVGPNPWKTKTDEEIATELLSRIEPWA